MTASRTTPLLEVAGLHVHYGSSRRLFDRKQDMVRAVDGVDLEVPERSIVGLVGESGCGKSSLARALVGLVPVTAGSIRFGGADLTNRRDRGGRKAMQMVFQDPVSSLNPALTVERTLAELLRVHRLVAPREVRARCVELLGLVGLPERVLGARPRQLSGGQRQRVAIARALAVEPRLLVADEAVAALDVSVQAGVLNVLADLRDQIGLTILFISHDLAVVRAICDRVAVMYLGRVVEEAPAEQLFSAPAHPYTKALLDAVPRLDARRAPGQNRLPGEPPSPVNIPSGCRFHPRCPCAEEDCRSLDPPSLVYEDHRAACLHPLSAALMDAGSSSPKKGASIERRNQT